MEASIILPTYNEKGNVLSVIKEINTYLNKVPHEIIVVDDNSPDGTGEVVGNLRQKNIRIIKRTNERGLVSAIQRGIDEAKGKVIVWIDCDLSHHPKYIPLLLEAIEKGNDIAIGSRFIKGGRDNRPFIRRLYSIAINRFAGLLLTSRITDYTTGFVAGKKNVFKTVRLRGNYGEYCIQFLYGAYKAGFKIEEVPYVTFDRIAGETKTAGSFNSLMGHAWNYGAMVLKLRMGLK